ncbi:MAG: CehA/McbA family metallohydrolase [Mucilaginibacter sp.]
MKRYCLFLIAVLSPFILQAQHEHHVSGQSLKEVKNVEPQPLLAHAGRLAEALTFLGSSLSGDDIARLNQLKNSKPDAATVKAIQDILDPYCLASVYINPEARVSVTNGPAKPVLMQNGWTSFLVKVYNTAASTAKLEVQSANAMPLLHVFGEEKLTAGMVANRFLQMAIYREQPLQANLSGLELEYTVLQVYSKDSGKREAELAFNIGAGTQDIGHRNATSILFDIKPAVKLTLQVIDDDGKPAMASFVIKDGIERIEEKERTYREKTSQIEYGNLSKRLSGVYPLPSRRMAETDEYPDFFFQPQVYRTSGEHISLAPGNYQVSYTRGPEYLPQTKQLTISGGVTEVKESFRLKRWINMAKLGWYSSDHHLHAAGCSHYASPEDGVAPPAMFRQALGEDLAIANVLAWGPGWYHQKQYFSGGLHPLSTKQNLLRYDVEISMFPSSFKGHIVLLNLKEDDYPGTTKIEDWPSWTYPILSWSKKQGGVNMYAHSGWGLEPVTPTKELPNYIIPKMDGIGANEYIVTVTQDVIDLYSAGDTPAQWELNMWYHTLNAGFRPRISGESDFPCIYDERVGLVRSYVKIGGKLEYPGYLEALKQGRSYVSDGRSHIVDFTVNGTELGTKNSEVALTVPGRINVKAKVAVYLNPEQDEAGARISQAPMDKQPYWSAERARIKTSRKVPVELIINGFPADTIEIVADGSWKDVSFTHSIKTSSWVAIRILPAAHTNPIFVLVDKKPIAIRKSAEWCRQTVDQCWLKKSAQIRKEEFAAAEEVYNKARAVYDKIIEQSGR